MNSIKHIFLIITLLITNHIYASSFDTKIFDQLQPSNTKTIRQDEEIIVHGNIKNTLLLNKQLNIVTEKNSSLIKNKIEKLKIDAWLYKGSPQVSFSNASKNCEINISYSESMQPFLLEDINKDIAFVVTHEIGHCILGKEIFNKINWQYDISLEKKKLIQNIIKKQTDAAIKIKNNKTEIIAPLPMIVYHEMFADTFSAIWLYNNGIINLSDIQNIAKERKIQYFVKQEKTAYLSFLPLYDYINMIDNKSVNTTMNINETIQLTTLIVQKNFIQYLMNYQ